MDELKELWQMVDFLNDRVRQINDYIENNYYKGYLKTKFDFEKDDSKFLVKKTDDKICLYSDKLEYLHDLEKTQKVEYYGICKGVDECLYDTFKQIEFLKSFDEFLVDLPNNEKVKLTDLMYNDELIVKHIGQSRIEGEILCINSEFIDGINMSKGLSFDNAQIENGCIKNALLTHHTLDVSNIYKKSGKVFDIEIKDLYYFVKKHLNIELYKK